MQTDFHYGVCYVLARLAGFSSEHAYKIAYSSQYVDDANNSGEIHFSNNKYLRYYRVSSAHKYSGLGANLQMLTTDTYNQNIWIPFHFLPGNNGMEAGEINYNSDFLSRLICRPNSPPARDMVKECLRHSNAASGLHRLGVTMHVYADTWSHQGFVGLLDDYNEVEDLESELNDAYRNAFDNTLPKIGHARAWEYPDFPFLDRWQYTNGRNETVIRQNTNEFMDAAIHMFRVMKQFIDPHQAPTEMLPADVAQLEILISGTTSTNANDRLNIWLGNIRSGAFSFGADQIPNYVPKEAGSWKYAALGHAPLYEGDDAEFTFSSSFMNSDWKKFHDALQAHRFFILHELLPSYGILCCSKPY